MPSNSKIAFALLGSLALVLTGVAGTAAAATEAPGADAPTAETEAGTTNCLQVYFEYEFGPVTYTYNCGGDVDVDEDWRPGLSVTDSHMQPSDNPVKCFLDADSGVERWACFFGPPGP